MMDGYVGPGRVAVAATLGIMAGAGITALAAHNAQEAVVETDPVRTIAADPLAYDTGRDDGYADGYQDGQRFAEAKTDEAVAKARDAGEDYGYEAGMQEGYEAGVKANREAIIALLATCHEDETLTVTLECVPMDDADYVGGVGWKVK